MGFTPMPTATLAEDLMGLSIRSARDCVRMHRRSQLYMPPDAGGPACRRLQASPARINCSLCRSLPTSLIDRVLLPGFAGRNMQADGRLSEPARPISYDLNNVTASTGVYQILFDKFYVLSTSKKIC